MPDRPLAITGAAALLGSDLDLESDATVVVESGRVAAAGARHDTSIPDDADILEAEGLLLLPGFIDAHVHIGLAAPSEVLAGGVTTARDLAWPRDEMRRLIQLSRGRDYDGPHLLWAGPMLTAPGGYPTRAGWAPEGTGVEVSSPEAGAEQVYELSRAGVDVIKVALNPAVGPTLDHWTLRAIVAAAHEQNLRVTAHIYGLDELKKALDAGIDEMAHMLMSPESIPAAVIDRMIAAGMTVVPTLAVFFGSERDNAVENLIRFLDAGGRVVYGTDLGNEGPQPGIDPREIAGLVDAEMTSQEIVASATSDAAAWLGLADRGAIVAGNVADLVAVPRDALDDPLLLTDVRMVMGGGRRVPALG